MFTILNILLILTSIIFIPFTKEVFLSPKDMVFTLLGFILVAYSYISNDIKTSTFKNRWIGFIFIYTILHFGWLFYRPLLLANNKVLWNLWNYLPTINIILAILLIQTLVEYTDNLYRWLNASKVLIWLGVGFSIYALLQYLGLDQIFSSKMYWMMSSASNQYKGGSFENYRMVTFLGNKMQTATILALVSPLCLMFRDLRYKVAYILIGGIIILTMSAINIIAMVVGLMAYLLLTKKIKHFLLLSGACVIGTILIYFYKPDFFNLYGKFDLYKRVFIDTKDIFFTGKGIGSFIKYRYDVNGLLVDKLGFEPLQVLFEGGIILLTLVSIYIVNLFIRIASAKKSMLLIGYTSALASFLIISLGGYTLHIAPFALIGIILTSGIEGQLQGG